MLGKIHRLPHPIHSVKGRRIEDAQPYGDGEPWNLAANAFDDRRQQPSTALEVASKPARTAARCQHFVEQIAMARLNVHEVKTRFVGNTSSIDVAVDQTLEFVVRPHHRIVSRINAELGIEQWMMEGDARFELVRAR